MGITTVPADPAVQGPQDARGPNELL